jgi:hypothetical protein
MLRQAGSALRGVHAANCYLRFQPRSRGDDLPLVVVPDTVGLPLIRVRSADAVGTVRRPSQALAVRDLVKLRGAVAPRACSATDQVRFLLSYLDLRRLTPAAKDLIRSVLQRSEPIAAR